MKNPLFLLLFLCACFGSAKAQINFDFTDSLVNQQKQYIIRFDVANGNIYLPVKKKTKINFNELSLLKKDIIKLKDSINIPLRNDTLINGNVIHRTSFQKVRNPAFKPLYDNLVRCLIAG